MTSPIEFPTEGEMDRAFLAYQNEMWWARMRESDQEVPPISHVPIRHGWGTPEQDDEEA